MKQKEEKEDLDQQDSKNIYEYLLEFIEIQRHTLNHFSYSISIPNLIRAMSLYNNTTYEEELNKFKSTVGVDIEDLEKNEFDEYEIIE